jgi:hypothetical protein
MAYSPSGSMATQPAPRLIVVTAVDGNGATAVGANLSILLDGQTGGALVLGNRPATLEVGNAAAQVVVRAEYTGMRLEADLGQDVHSYRFQFPIVAPPRFVPPTAVAQCPDKTTGAPCVICDIAGTKVRICV